MPVLTASDLPEVVPLFRALHAFHAPYAPERYHTAGQDAEYLAFLKDKAVAGAWFYGHDDGAGLAAYLMALPERLDGDFLHHPRVQVKLDHLYVAPRARGQGVGQALIAEMEARMRTEGFERWYVGHDAVNAGAAAFYAAQGAVPRAAFLVKRIPD